LPGAHSARDDRFGLKQAWQQSQGNGSRLALIFLLLNLPVLALYLLFLITWSVGLMSANAGLFWQSLFLLGVTGLSLTFNYGSWLLSLTLLSLAYAYLVENEPA
jgi:hypothetical protein